MQEYYSLLERCPLFNNVSPKDYPHILSCLDVSVKTYHADDYVVLTGNELNFVGIILEGSAEILKEDFAGNRHIIALLSPSHLFGEGIVCTRKRISPVSVRTRTTCKILHIPYIKILTSCHHACSFHTTMIYNMMLILGEKNVILNQKIDLVTLKGMREKLATYLLSESNRTQNQVFYINFNRNELAEYLHVSRPSMSRELCRMKEEGLIDFHKNCFKITNKEGLMQSISDS